MKPCGATQSCCACRTGARLPALRPCASQSLRRLRTGPSHPWLGRSPGQQSTGLLSFSGSPCCAWKTGTAHPCSVRSPGQSLRLRTPCVAWAPAQVFRGLGVRRDQRPPDARLIPAHPPEPWHISGSPMASPCGREKCHWHFSFIGLTPVGSAPASLLATVSEINALHVLGYGRSLWGSAYRGFFSSQRKKQDFCFAPPDH